MRISIRVRPGARADVVGGQWAGPRGPALVVAVRARAVEGAANAAGARGRDEVVDLDGEDAEPRARLAQLLGAVR